MAFKIKTLLLKCDFIGLIPQFRILNEFRYKSIFSSILSILIIIFSIVFILYSFIDFIDQHPKVEYYKNNDYETNKSFVISDSLLMFQYYFMCLSDPSKFPDLTLELDIPLEKRYERPLFEHCELGKNINLKYKDLLEKFNSIEKWKSNTYLCINYNSINMKNFTLYSHPLIPYEEENSLTIYIKTDCDDYSLNLKLITENDFIDHNNKDNPFVPYYKRNEFLINTGNKKSFNYYFQYIKLELDDGFIFNNPKIMNGIGVAGIDEIDTISWQNLIFSLTFKINNANYDYYLNTFKKFQTFLAEIMSLINLIITISNFITEFLLYKKMNKDIIRYILTTNYKKEITKGKTVFLKDKIFNQVFESDDKIKKDLLKKRITENKIQDEHNSKSSFNISKKDNISEVENMDNTIISVMKNLNFINIMKSFFCFKDKKMKLINLCNDIVQKDICVERILKRLYILENNYNSIIEKNNDKIDKINLNDDFSKIKKIVNKIDIELGNQTKNI